MDVDPAVLSSVDARCADIWILVKVPNQDSTKAAKQSQP
jgi:hypothetical protein